MTPMPSAVTMEPNTEPMPPMTTMAKTMITRLEPMPEFTCRMGAASTPVKAASAMPAP